MTLVNIKTATTGTDNIVGSDHTKLVPEVTKMVQNMPGGVSGLVKQFQDRGLANVAWSLTTKNRVRTILPAQLVQGLGMEKIERLAIATGLEVRVVRKELVNVLPYVLEQLAPAETAVEPVAATAIAR